MKLLLTILIFTAIVSCQDQDEKSNLQNGRNTTKVNVENLSNNDSIKNMNWERLKKQIYTWDGSWLDVYVHNTSKKDWEKWSQFVNENYDISWYNGVSGNTESKIDFQVIREFWNGDQDLSSTAKVNVGNIHINAHFFVDTEIENDVDPREFNTIDDHNKLIEYLKNVSKTTNKEVTVTPENLPENVLIKVKDENVEILI